MFRFIVREIAGVFTVVDAFGVYNSKGYSSREDAEAVRWMMQFREAGGRA